VRLPASLAAALAFLVLAPSLAAQEETAPLRNWQAPPFWQATETAGDREAVPGKESRETLAVPTNALPFIGINPCRIADTRDGSFPAGFGPPSLVGGAAGRTFTVPAGPCPGLPANAGAWSLNFTVVAPAGTPPGGYLSVWPAGGVQPIVSTLNFTSGSILANAAVVPAGTGGGINVFVNFSTDLIIDINGYYSGAGVVTSVSALTGDVTLAAGPNTSITPSGNTLTISSVGTLTGVTAGTGISVTGGAPSPTVLIPPSGINADRIASGQVVKSVNSVKDDVTIQGSGAVSVNTVGSTVTIGAPSGSFVLGAPGDSTLIGAGYTEVGASSIEFWGATSVTGAVPAARYYHTAVWTGTEMIVWGGFTGSYLNTGGRYNPATNAWTATSTGTNCPAGRYDHTAVWTGTEMIVWGGLNGAVLNTGGRYTPTSNTWAATDTAFAPAARQAHTGIWTGTTMIVWGGAPITNTGGIYTPSTNGWTATSTGTNCPTARWDHSAVWTGSQMVVWGGYDGGADVNTGARYNSGSNTWATMATGPAARERHSAVWTGSEMIVWGGYSGGAMNTGSRYNPGSNTWSAMSTLGAPLGRYLHTAVWTGSKMIVWGGYDGATAVSSGGIYAPDGNDWAATTGVGAPPARYGLAGVWTGSKMIVWGGSGTESENTGGIYQFLSVYKKN